MTDPIQRRVHTAVSGALDKKASDLDVLQVTELTSIADYFIICSATSERQAQAIADGVQEKLRAGAQACKRLGKPCGTVGGNPEIVANFLDHGFSWVAFGSDLAMLASRATEYLGAVRTRIGVALVWRASARLPRSRGGSCGRSFSGSCSSQG